MTSKLKATMTIYIHIREVVEEEEGMMREWGGGGGGMLRGSCSA